VRRGFRGVPCTHREDDLTVYIGCISIYCRVTGLATHYVPSSEIPALVTKLQSCAGASEVRQAPTERLGLTLTRHIRISVCASGSRGVRLARNGPGRTAPRPIYTSSINIYTYTYMYSFSYIYIYTYVYMGESYGHIGLTSNPFVLLQVRAACDSLARGGPWRAPPSLQAHLLHRNLYLYLYLIYSYIYIYTHMNYIYICASRPRGLRLAFFRPRRTAPRRPPNSDRRLYLCIYTHIQTLTGVCVSRPC